MQKRSGKTRDVNQIAFEVARLSAGEAEPVPEPEKNPAAVALGRLGGLKGGRARAEMLSAKKRTEIARKAANKRWERKVSHG